MFAVLDCGTTTTRVYYQGSLPALRREALSRRGVG